MCWGRDLLHGHALHLDEPCGTTYGSEGEDGWDVRILLPEHLADYFEVGGIAQIDNQLSSVSLTSS